MSKLEGKKVIIASDGSTTQIFVDGKVYGNHIEEFTYHHAAGDVPQINIKASDLPVEGDLSIDTFKYLLDKLLENNPKFCEHLGLSAHRS